MMRNMMKIFRYEQSEEEIRNVNGPVVFLAGPTVRGNQLHLRSWRIDAGNKKGVN